MKILFVIDSFFTGGAEFSTLEIIRFLKEKGVQIHTCKLKDKLPQYDASLFGFDNSNITTLPKENFFAKRKALKSLIADFKPDIVHSVLFNSNLLVRSIRIFDSSFIHLESLVNHTYSKERLKDPRINSTKLELHRWLNRTTAFFGTDHFHPNGLSVSEHFQQKLSIPSKKMTLVHRGRNSKNYDVTPFPKSEFGIANDQLVLINVGRQDFQKGHDILLDSISLLPDSVKAKVVLVVVGREGNATASIQKLLVEKKLESNVMFLGHRTDVPALLKMADIFVFPSRFEGLPGALIEAEAAGLPIICSHLSMMLEVVEPNQNAITFDIDNTQAVTDAIVLLAENEKVRAQFAKKSRAIFEERFQIEAVHQSMYLLYKKLIKSPK
ncbi:MAG: glycosyltransferase family 4 protein [Bacteroidota bacterium]